VEIRIPWRAARLNSYVHLIETRSRMLFLWKNNKMKRFFRCAVTMPLWLLLCDGTGATAKSKAPQEETVLYKDKVAWAETPRLQVPAPRDLADGSEP